MLSINQDIIDTAKKDKKILLKTIEQIQKDFERFQVHLDFNDNGAISYNELVDKLANLSEQLLNQNTELFFSILYSIDLPEEHIYRALFSEKHSTDLKTMSALIVNRELMKVLTRITMLDQPNKPVIVRSSNKID